MVPRYRPARTASTLSKAARGSGYSQRRSNRQAKRRGESVSRQTRRPDVSDTERAHLGALQFLECHPTGLETLENYQNTATVRRPKELDYFPVTRIFALPRGVHHAGHQASFSPASRQIHRDAPARRHPVKAIGLFEPPFGVAQIDASNNHSSGTWLSEAETAPAAARQPSPCEPASSTNPRPNRSSVEILRPPCSQPCVWSPRAGPSRGSRSDRRELRVSASLRDDRGGMVEIPKLDIEIGRQWFEVGGAEVGRGARYIARVGLLDRELADAATFGVIAFEQARTRRSH